MSPREKPSLISKQDLALCRRGDALRLHINTTSRYMNILCSMSYKSLHKISYGRSCHQSTDTTGNQYLVRFPLRKSPDRSFLPAPRSLSQVDASLILVTTNFSHYSLWNSQLFFCLTIAYSIYFQFISTATTKHHFTKNCIALFAP